MTSFRVSQVWQLSKRHLIFIVASNRSRRPHNQMKRVSLSEINASFLIWPELTRGLSDCKVREGVLWITTTTFSFSSQSYVFSKHNGRQPSVGNRRVESSKLYLQLCSIFYISCCNSKSVRKKHWHEVFCGCHSVNYKNSTTSFFLSFLLSVVLTGVKFKYESFYIINVINIDVKGVYNFVSTTKL